MKQAREKEFNDKETSNSRVYVSICLQVHEERHADEV